MAYSVLSQMACSSSYLKALEIVNTLKKKRGKLSNQNALNKIIVVVFCKYVRDKSGFPVRILRHGLLVANRSEVINFVGNVEVCVRVGERRRRGRGRGRGCVSIT